MTIAIRTAIAPRPEFRGFYFVILGRNNKVFATSEVYTRKSDACRGARRMRAQFKGIVPFVDESTPNGIKPADYLGKPMIKVEGSIKGFATKKRA